MSVIAVTGGVAAVAGGVTAAASGWSSPTGLAAFITALVGAGAFVWSVVHAASRKKEIDVAAAVELIKALERRDRED